MGWVMEQKLNLKHFYCVFPFILMLLLTVLFIGPLWVIFFMRANYFKSQDAKFYERFYEPLPLRCNCLGVMQNVVKPKQRCGCWGGGGVASVEEHHLP